MGDPISVSGDKWGPTLYAAIEAIAEGKVAEVEIEHLSENHDETVIISVAVRREVKRIQMPDGGLA